MIAGLLARGAAARHTPHLSSLKNFALPGVALLAVIAYWIWRSSAPAPQPAAEPPATKAPSRPTATPNREPRDPASKPAPTTAAEPPPTEPTTAAEPPRTTRRDRSSTDALRLALRDRHRSGGGGGRGKGSELEDDEPVPGTLDKDYIRTRIQDDLVPIAKECYESALEDQPELGGKVVMKFSIVGDESVGGVVDEANVDPTSDITHPDLLECMRESMLSLSFPPPEGGGTVSVTYPFVFAADGPPAAPK